MDRKYFIMIFILVGIHLVPALYYTCEETSQKEFFTLNSTYCHFVDNNSTEILCRVYIDCEMKYETFNYTYITKYFEGLATFYVQTEQITWNGERVVCLGLRHIAGTMLDELPHGESVYKHIPISWFKNMIAEHIVFEVIESAHGEVMFNSTSSVGLLKLHEKCSPGNWSDAICIEELYLSQCVIRINHTCYRDKFPHPKRIIDMYQKLYGAEITTVQFISRVKNVLYKGFRLVADDIGTLFRFQYIDVSHNHVKSIEGNAFGPMSELKFLGLSDCQLTSIDSAVFYNMPNLKSLDLSFNILNRSVDFHMLSNLEALNMSKQNVTTFDITLLRNLTVVKQLNISGNNLINLNTATFSNSVSLEVLDMSDCGLTQIPPNAFDHLNALKIIILDGNSFHTLASDAFLKLPSGVVLSLQHCTLTSSLGLQICNVSLLNLAGNKFTTPRDIIATGSIDTLDISFNHIFNWTKNEIFNTENRSIRNINLSYNSIASINDAMEPSLQKLKSFDLGGNPLDCQDCSLLQFQHWLNTSNTEILDLGRRIPITCALPPLQKGQLISEAQYNETLCTKPNLSYAITLGIPGGLVTILVVSTIIVSYVFRYEIHYIRHLLQIRKENNRGTSRNKCVYDAFVCYCRQDREWVLEVLLPGLENPTDRYKLCLHERDFRIGKAIIENIGSCIENSRRILLVLSPNFIKSQWCQWELRIAQQRLIENSGDFLILLELEKLERTSLPMHLRSLMETRTYLEWPADSGRDLRTLRDFWTRLKEALGSALVLSPEIDECTSDMEDDELLFATTSSETLIQD